MRVLIRHGYVVVPGKALAPQSCQSTRELSKANDGENPAVYKEFLHVIKYVIDTKNLGLKIKPKINPNKPCEIVCFSNSDYAGDPLSS